MSTREYSDSGSDHDDNDVEMHDTSVAEPIKPPSAGPSNLRVTLRPGLSHLMNQSEPIRPIIPPSDRSSLSPPPPITLKLGMKPKPERVYSSDEDTYPSKKPKSASKKKVHPPPLEENTMQAQHRKSYDWLQPSTASASHQGPPERVTTITGWHPEAVDVQPTIAKPKKSHKKKPDGAPPGPGKSWRKGMKKGMAMPWREGQPFLMGQGSPSATPGRGTPFSGEGSPEPFDMPEISLAHYPRGSSPPFVIADPVNLGFPVFSKPIATPVTHLTNFPKVTAFFAEHDSTRPFRRERPRTWKHSERTFVGIGGGQLKFKTWTKGPPSELGRILQAEKDAREVIPRPPKNKPASSALTVNSIEGLTTGTPLERPPLTSQASDPHLEGEDTEVGEEVTPTKPKPKKAKPRKSKLAQEVIPEPAVVEDAPVVL